MFSLTLKYDNDSIKYKACMEMRNRYHFSNVNRNLENLLPILMRLTSVVLTSWISSITGKISWIVAWPWSNNVCLCVSVRLCLSVIGSTNWYMGRKTNIGIIFLSGNLDFGLEKSWKNHGTFFWDFCGNPGKCQSFWDRKCLGLRGTRTPNLRIHAECSNLLSYQGQTFAVPCFEHWLWRYRFFFFFK